jgi:hypothetical protein
LIFELEDETVISNFGTGDCCIVVALFLPPTADATDFPFFEEEDFDCCYSPDVFC